MWIGLATCSVLWLSLQFWSIPVAVLLALTVELLLTGAFHEDALADCFDAFGGGWEKDQILTIMKDSRIGTYGTLALILGVSLRGILTWELVERFETSPFHWMLILTTAATAARANSVWLMWSLPPVEHKEGLAKDISQQMSLPLAQQSTLIVLPLLALYLFQFPLQALVGLTLSLLLLWWAISYLKKKIGGITGDCLGCLCYLTQLLMLLTSALSINLPMETVS